MGKDASLLVESHPGGQLLLSYTSYFVNEPGPGALHISFISSISECVSRQAGSMFRSGGAQEEAVQ